MGSTDPESRGEAGRASHISGQQQRPRMAGLVSRFRARFTRADATPSSKPPPPAPAPPPSPKQTIAGEDLARQLREQGGRDDVEPVHLANYKVVGDVNLSHCRITNAVRFVNCEFERFSAPDAVMFGLSFTDCVMKAFGAQSAKFETDLKFTGCHVGPEGIVAENARLSSDVRIVSTTCVGPINFADSVFQGDVILQDVTLRDQRLTLDDASVGGSVRIKGCDFKGSKLELGSMKVTFRIELQELKHHPHHLYFTGTSTTTYKEDKTAWPDKGGLYVDRFTYERLSVTEFNVQRHLAWLNLQDPKHLGKDFRSHPWRHLAQLLKKRGAADDARRLSIAYRDAMLDSGVYTGGAKLAHRLFKHSCGYGLKPWRPVWLLGVVVVAGAILFEAAAIVHLVRPADSVYVLGLKSKTLGLKEPPKEYPVFNPILYSLENTLPAVNLGQNDHFHVHVGWHGPKDLPPSPEMETLRSPWASSIAGILGVFVAMAGATILAMLLSVLIPLQAIIGVILASLTVLSFTGVFEQRLLD